MHFKELTKESNSQSKSEIPGLHIIANLKSDKHSLLASSLEFRTLADHLVVGYGLNHLGSVYHDFPIGGFTAVICLAESHLSVHTWPESGYITFDIFLSNYSKDNRAVAIDIYRKVVDFFEASVLDEHFLNR